MERTININKLSLEKEPQILEKVNEESSKISPNEIHFRFFELKNTASRKMHKRDDLREIQQLKISLDTDGDISRIGRGTDFIKINETYLWAAKLEFDDTELEGFTELNFTLKVELKNENKTQEHKIKAPVESFKKKEWNCVMMTLFDDELECNFISESDPEFFANSNSGELAFEQGTITESLPVKGDSDEFVSPNNSFISPIRYENNRINEEKEINSKNIHINSLVEYNDIKDCFERFRNSFLHLNFYLSNCSTIENLYNVITQKILNPFMSQIEIFKNGSNLRILKESLDEKKLRSKLNDTEAIILLLIKIYSDLINAFERLILNNQLFVKLRKFGRFYELLEALQNEPLTKEETLKELEDYNKYTNTEEFEKLKECFDQPEFEDELAIFINETSEILFFKSFNPSEININAIENIMKHFKHRCLSEVKLVLNSINKLNQDKRKYPARNTILNIKFSTFIIKYNMEAVFFNEHKSLIQKKFTIFPDLENKSYLEYTNVLKTSYERVLNILRSLDSGDDLFNYLSFLTSDIIKVKNQLVFKFTPKNTFSRLKKLLCERMFDYFILYEYEPIENPIFRQIESNIQQNAESYDQVGFVENVLLNRVCCLDISLMSENVSQDLKIEKYSFKILHEIVHLLLYEKNITLDSRFLRTPLIEKILKNPRIKKADSGDMLEYLMADHLVDSFLKDKRDYLPEFFETIRKPDTLKGNLISFIDTLQNRGDHAKPSVLPSTDLTDILEENDNQYRENRHQFTSSIMNSRSHNNLNKEDKNEIFDIKKNFECYSSKFETHFSIKLEDYFCPRYKKRVLGILYVCNLKPVERKFPREELFGKIFDLIKNLLEELKKIFPRKMRMMYNQNTINQFLRILERVYNINNN